MTITRYYDLRDRQNERARRIRLKDLELFEREAFPIDFFSNERDVLEFAVYDLGDSLVNWIEIDDDNPRIVIDGRTQENTTIPAIILDTVEHLKLSGIDKGSVYISYQFFKNRVGSSAYGNRVFIQEISPSRTEVRILPALTGNEQLDFYLVRDFQHFKHNDIFIDDVVLAVIYTYEAIYVSSIDDLMNENFYFQFQYDYGISGAQLQEIKTQILVRTRERLINRILQEEDDFMSRPRLQALFIMVLQEVVEELIPHIDENIVTPGSDLGLIREVNDRWDVPVNEIPDDEIITGDYDPGIDYDNTPTSSPPPIDPDPIPDTTPAPDIDLTPQAIPGTTTTTSGGTGTGGGNTSSGDPLPPPPPPPYPPAEDPVNPPPIVTDTNPPPPLPPTNDPNDPILDPNGPTYYPPPPPIDPTDDGGGGISNEPGQDPTDVGGSYDPTGPRIDETQEDRNNPLTAN